MMDYDWLIKWILTIIKWFDKNLKLIIKLTIHLSLDKEEVIKNYELFRKIRFNINEFY